jgi:hypothetical protein
MKKIAWILAVFLVQAWVGHAWGADLDQVEILSVTPSQGGLELKLHSKTRAPDTYFLVNLVASDTQHFEKMSLVIQKLKDPSGLELDLKIPSFSEFPNGSFYRSDSVKFSGRVVKK